MNLWIIFSGVPDSKTFDVTLLITLLRNLTKIAHPHVGFDLLPTDIETSPGSDLSRIKYYRNYLFHLDDGQIESAYFKTAWDNLSGVGFIIEMCKLHTSLVFLRHLFSVFIFYLPALTFNNVFKWDCLCISKWHHHI